MDRIGNAFFKNSITNKLAFCEYINGWLSFILEDKNLVLFSNEYS